MLNLPNARVRLRRERAFRAVDGLVPRATASGYRDPKPLPNNGSTERLALAGRLQAGPRFRTSCLVTDVGLWVVDRGRVGSPRRLSPETSPVPRLRLSTIIRCIVAVA